MIYNGLELMKEQRELDKKVDIIDIQHNINRQNDIVAKVKVQIDAINEKKALGGLKAAELRYVNIQVGMVWCGIYCRKGYLYA